MTFVFKRLILLTSIAAAFAADKEKPKFEVAPAREYPHHQTSDKVTVAASVFETGEQAEAAFGKDNPYRYGILPVLVVIQNDSPDAIRVDRLKVEYVTPDRSRIENTPAQDLRYLRSGKKPKMVPTPIGGVHIGKSKQPMSGWEIEGRGFLARVIPPGQSASGFFYFQTGHRSGSTLYLAGMEDAKTGKELLYFEIPLEGVK
ncbi:MAG: hypothetical protein M3Z85_01160 [Acidobacteriota bacterium]|nr:hypothetical protein [Acidobacteriota bacterium]